MIYPQAFDLSVYSLTAATFLAALITSYQKCYKVKMLVYPKLVATRVQGKEGIQSPDAWLSVMLFIIVWILSAFYIIFMPAVSSMGWIAKIWIDTFLWTIVAVATAIGGFSLSKWVRMIENKEIVLD